jgi:hypothetical protein
MVEMCVLRGLAGAEASKRGSSVLAVFGVISMLKFVALNKGGEVCSETSRDSKAPPHLAWKLPKNGLQPKKLLIDAKTVCFGFIQQCFSRKTYMPSDISVVVRTLMEST